MALLSRLHWWTGRVRTHSAALENPKIYGAGLLSSLANRFRASNRREKIPTPSTREYAVRYHDETATAFVCHDFKHLADVLEDLPAKMAYQIGGLEGIHKAIECKQRRELRILIGLPSQRYIHRSGHGEKGQPFICGRPERLRSRSRRKNCPDTESIITRKDSGRRSAMERNWDRRRQEGRSSNSKAGYRGRKDRQDTSPRRANCCFVTFLELPCEIRRPRLSQFARVDREVHTTWAVGERIT